VIKFLASLLVVMGINGPVEAHHIRGTVGWLVGFDEMTDEVYLDDGKTYYASPRINFSSLVLGERFFIEFVETNSHKRIVAMMPIPVMDEPLLTWVND
jgi:hypothetical protein